MVDVTVCGWFYTMNRLICSTAYCSFSLSLSLWSLLMYVLAHRYATLYMNPDTMEVSDIMFIQHAVSAVGKLCPDQRRVPQLVSFFVVVVVLY